MTPPALPPAVVEALLSPSLDAIWAKLLAPLPDEDSTGRVGVPGGPEYLNGSREETDAAGGLIPTAPKEDGDVCVASSS